MPAFLSAHTSLSIPAFGAFQLHLTPFNSIPQVHRRIVNPFLVSLVERAMKVSEGGPASPSPPARLHLRTDDRDYGAHMRAVMKDACATGRWTEEVVDENDEDAAKTNGIGGDEGRCSHDGGVILPGREVETKYERRGIASGCERITNLCYRYVGDGAPRAAVAET